MAKFIFEVPDEIILQKAEKVRFTVENNLRSKKASASDIYDGLAYAIVPREIQRGRNEFSVSYEGLEKPRLYIFENSLSDILTAATLAVFDDLKISKPKTDNSDTCEIDFTKLANLGNTESDSKE